MQSQSIDLRVLGQHVSGSWSGLSTFLRTPYSACMLTPFEVQGDVKVWDGLEVRDNREDGIFQLKEPGPVEVR